MNFSLEQQYLLPLALTLTLLFFLMLAWVLLRLSHIKKLMSLQNEVQENRIKELLTKHFFRATITFTAKQSATIISSSR